MEYRKSGWKVVVLLYFMRTGFFVHRRIRSAVKKQEFVSDRVSCITLKGRWCDIIEDKDDDIINRILEWTLKR